MATTTVIASIQSLLKAEIGPTVLEMLPTEIDPAFDAFEISQDGVEPFAPLSQGWLIRLTLSSGLAGALKWIGLNQESVNSNTSRYHTNATRVPDARYPSATNLPIKSIIPVTVPLTAGKGNISWPLEFKRAEKMSAMIEEYTDLNIQAAARMVALNQANSFFAPVNGVIAQVSGTPSSTGASDGIVITSVDNGRIFQFQDGMLVDIYTNGGGTWTQKNLNASGVAIRTVVDGVDYLGDSLRLVGDETYASAVADNDLIILKDSYVNDSTDYAYKGPMGLLDMMKDAAASTYCMSPNNSSSYGFDLSKYPNFGSLVVAVSGVLDEPTMNKYLGQFFDATGLPLDTIITTRGVLNKMSELPTLDAGRMIWDRTGKGLAFTMGRGDVKVTYEGKDFAIKQSRFCPPGYLFAMKRAGNYKIVTPPAQPDTTSKASKYGAPIEFIGQALGYADDFIPVTVNDCITDMVQSPFNLYYQIVCKTPQGIVLTGITEN